MQNDLGKQTPVASYRALSLCLGRFLLEIENASRHSELKRSELSSVCLCSLLHRSNRGCQEDPKTRKHSVAPKPHSLDPSGPSTAALRQKCRQTPKMCEPEALRLGQPMETKTGPRLHSLIRYYQFHSLSTCSLIFSIFVEVSI